MACDASPYAACMLFVRSFIRVCRQIGGWLGVENEFSSIQFQLAQLSGRTLAFHTYTHHKHTRSRTRSQNIFVRSVYIFNRRASCGIKPTYTPRRVGTEFYARCIVQCMYGMLAVSHTAASSEAASSARNMRECVARQQTRHTHNTHTHTRVLD